VALFVALPLAGVALHRAGVRMAPIPRTLVRPLAAGVLAAVVTVVVARIIGSYQIVSLAVAGVASLLCYIAIVMPTDQLRRLAMSRGGGGQAPA
jgi:hypothetical protein